MTVLEPTSNGIGSDCFALVWVKDKLYGLNASGHAPELATPEYIKEQGYSKMPVHGWTQLLFLVLFQVGLNYQNDLEN